MARLNWPMTSPSLEGPHSPVSPISMSIRSSQAGIGMGRRVVRIAADRLFKVGSSGARCLATELMLAGDAAKRQFEHVEGREGRPQNGVFLYFPYAGVQTSGDPACDLVLHLRNIRRIAGEAVSPSNAAVAEASTSCTSTTSVPSRR